MDQIKQDAQARMRKCIETLKNELGKLRSGRAHAGILEHIMVPYYGNDTPINQVASISVADPRTLLVTPWEKALVPAIEKAIRSSDLGLNPAAAGQAIRVPLPPLTEERRKDLTKVVRQEVETARVAIRNVRRDANTAYKDLLKAKTISEDEERRAQDAIQKLTDKFISEIDNLLAEKEKELMEI
jgi:ribosome recycling factor